MNHEYIKEFNLVDQYVLGRLAAKDAEAFEDHFIECPECVEQVNTARNFIHDLKGMAVEETLSSGFERSPKSGTWQLRRFVPLGSWAIASGCVVVMVVFAFFAVRRMSRLEAELRQAREDTAIVTQKYQQSLEATAESDKRREQTNHELAERVADLEKKLKTDVAPGKRDQSSVRTSDAPEVNFPIYALISVPRGVPAPVEISLPASSSRFALSIPVEDTTDFSSYRVMISDQRGRTIFKRAGFKPDAYHTLSLSLNSNSLNPGTYDLQVEGLTPPNKWSIVGSYPFRVARRR